MKPAGPAANRFGRIIVASSLWKLSVAVCHAAAVQVTDPTLNLTIRITNQTAVLSWPGANAVPYQLESSSDLNAWASVGPALNGTGATLSVTNPVVTEGSAFYRVKRLFPAAEGSAVFDPATGLLTVVGDDSDNIINIGLNGATIFVTIGGLLVPITGGTPTTSNTLLIQVLGLGGNDQISINNGLPPAHLFGGTGNDTLLGGSAADLLVGGPGNDFIDGNLGSDLVFLGDGDDTFQWDPGEGNDVVEGGDGHDILLFNGANIAENIDISANGQRLRFTRNIASIVLDADGIEQVIFNARGGADNVTVNNLAGTAVTRVDADLASIPGGGTGDTAADSVILNATPGPDTINFTNDSGAVVVTGIVPEVRVFGAESNLDRLVYTGVGGDIVNVNGTESADTNSVVANGTFARVTASGYTAGLDVNGAVTLSINGLGGPDTLTAGNGLTTLIPLLRMDGGEGSDTILGGDGNDLLIGGPGQDFIDGNLGSDTVLLGDDDDTYQWDPGDGNDTIEGGGGHDILRFNGSNIGENIDISANGQRLRFTRNIASIVLDADGIEQIDFTARGGADNVVVNDLAGTTVTQVNVDLASIPGNGTGDSATDVVTLNGTTGPDTINFTNDSGAIVITGLAAAVRVVAAEASYDRIVVNGVGNDLVNINGSPFTDTMIVAPNGEYARVIATGYAPPIDVVGSLTLSLNGMDGTDTLAANTGDLAVLGIPIRLDGGEGDDTIYGSNGSDVIIGGPGADVVDGNQGNDTVYLGEGDDVYFWDPGDGNDTIEGEGGNDILVVNGSNIAEGIDLSANGSRLRFTRNIGSVNLDVNGVERVDFNALGGVDGIVVNSLAGTDVTQVNIDLAGALGGGTGDSSADTVTVNGTAAPDTINVAANAGVVEVSGLAAFVRVLHSEVIDTLVVNGLAGTDTITVGPGVTSLITPIINQ